MAVHSAARSKFTLSLISMLLMHKQHNRLFEILNDPSGMEHNHSSNSDSSKTSTDSDTYQDEESLETRSRSETPPSRTDPGDPATLDESGILSDDERIISSEEDEDSETLANREDEVTSGQSQATSSAMISTAPSSMTCSGPRSPSVLQDPDVELAESVREALCLSGENPFCTLTENEAADVGDRLRKVLTHAADGALVPLLHSVLNRDEVMKLAALKGILGEDSQSLFSNVQIKKEEPMDSQSTDDIDERMLEADADMTEIQNWKKEINIKEEPLSQSSEAPVVKAASLDIDKVIYLSSDEENETRQGQKIQQASATTKNAASEFLEAIDAAIIQEIKEVANDDFIDGILSGRKRSKRHNYFDSNESRDQITSKLVAHTACRSFLIQKPELTDPNLKDRSLNNCREEVKKRPLAAIENNPANEVATSTPDRQSSFF